MTRCTGNDFAGPRITSITSLPNSSFYTQKSSIRVQDSYISDRSQRTPGILRLIGPHLAASRIFQAKATLKINHLLPATMMKELSPRVISEIDDLHHGSPTMHLPTELVLEIAEHLRHHDVQRLAQVSHRLRLIGGPMIYREQRASSVRELVMIKAVAEQPDVALMIKSLNLDTISMNYWWHGIAQMIGHLLPPMQNLEVLSLRLSHSLPHCLCQSISQLSQLSILRIHLKNATLGPHIGLITGLKEVDLELAPPSWSSVDEVIGELTLLLKNSQRTLEKLSIQTIDSFCTSNMVNSMGGLSPLRSVLASCNRLSSVLFHLEVKDETSALDTVEAISFLPVIDLRLKCNASIFPLPPSAGYGLGIQVLQRISELLPKLQRLQLEDGEIGKRNLHRPPNGVVFEEHLNCLRKLEHLQTADIPILMDDLLVYVPTSQNDEALSKANGTPDQEGSSNTSAPRVEFEKNLNDLVSRAVQCLLVPPKVDGYSTSMMNALSQPRCDIGGDGPTPLSYLTSIRFRIRPTPFLAKNMRGARVYLPSMEWSKRLLRDSTNQFLGWQPELTGLSQ